MALNSIYETSLFPNVRQRREGIQCERTLRLLLFLLDGWSKFAPTTKPLTRPRGLTAIPFDKFAMLIFRIWAAMFQASGGDPDNDELDSGVTFPPPFRPIPGKHGRGPGRWEGPGKGRPAYLVNILFELQSEGLLHYFRITPPRQDPNNPSNDKTMVLPALPVTDTREFLSCFNRTEQKVLLDLQSALKRLEAQELRALGTHFDRNSTIEDIKREFKYLDKLKAEAVVALESDNFIMPAQAMMEFADEAWRKSSSNADCYARAYDKALREIGDNELRTVFLECQHPAEQIWGDSPSILSLKEKAAVARFFTRYFYALARYKEQRNSSKNPGKDWGYKKLWDESLSGLRQCGLSGFPSTPQSAFVRGINEIEPKVRELLIQSINAL